MSEPVILPARLLIRVNARAGQVRVRCEDRADVAVLQGIRHAGEAKISGDEIAIRALASSVEILCPIGTNLNIGTIAGGVEIEGEAGDVRVNTATGRVRIQRAQRADLRTMSGRIEVAECGHCRLATKSGRVSISAAQSVEIASISGGIELGRVEGEARVKSVSGRVEIGASGRKDLEIYTISGSVRVRLPEGTRPDVRFRMVANRARNPFAPGDDCRVAVSTVSGKVELVAI